MPITAVMRACHAKQPYSSRYAVVYMASMMNACFQRMCCRTRAKVQVEKVLKAHSLYCFCLQEVARWKDARISDFDGMLVSLCKLLQSVFSQGNNVQDLLALRLQVTSIRKQMYWQVRTKAALLDVMFNRKLLMCRTILPRSWLHTRTAL